MASQLVGVAFSARPFAPQIPLKRATALICPINIIVHRNVHGPSAFDGGLQRMLVVEAQLHTSYRV